MPDTSPEARDKAKPRVSTADVAEGLRQLGLRAADLVVVHSSLSAFGYVEGGADSIITALLETVGEHGTVAMPTFHEGALYRPPKDPRVTPSVLGTIGNAFCRRDGVLRSQDCNMAAIGPLALEILSYAPVPPGRPRHNLFYRIVQLGGRILLLGVGHNRNSTLHTAQALAMEEVEGIPVDIYEPPGGLEFLEFRDDIFDPVLTQHGYMTKGMIGAAQVRLIDGKGLYEVTKRLYQESEELRAHTRAYLQNIARSRLELFRAVQQFAERERRGLEQADKLRGAIHRLRYILMEIADERSVSRDALSALIEDGDLRLFAAQLEGRLLNDFEATMKILQDQRFVSLVEDYVRRE